MKNTNYAGLDYGRTTGTNRNRETGIHYGVISQNSIIPEALDDFSTEYGEPHCPKCGNPVKEVPSHTESSNPPGAWVSVISDIPDAWENFERYSGHGCEEYACEGCEIFFDSSDCLGDEPIGYDYDRDGYKLHNGTADFGIWIFESPYYTKAQFCSPCAPGAGNLDTYCKDGPTTYCLGHDWFEGDKAPYPVYSVATGKRVYARK